MVVALAWYLVCYIVDLRNTTWDSLAFPTGFYLLLVLFILGWLLTIAAFWLDRYRLPVLLFVAVWLLLVYLYPFRIDHNFDLNHRVYVGAKPWAPFVPVEALNLPSVEEDLHSNAYLKALALREDSHARDKEIVTREGPHARDQVFVSTVLDSGKWVFPGPKGKRTLVVVTASGGGIQSAAWTTKVLTELDRICPGLSQSIFLVSSVSGGSVGAMYYLGGRGVRDPEVTDPTHLIRGHPAPEDPEGDTQRKRICTVAQESCLEACGWGLAFPDLFQALIPGTAPRFADRGFALEAVWWSRMGRTKADRRAMSEVTIKDLAYLVEAGYAPAVVFNATCVETGQRVGISPVRLEVSQGTVSEDKHLLLSQPIDLLSWYDSSLNSRKADLRVTTSVRLSASFAYVTPVARPDFHPSVGDPWKDECRNRQYLHYCDGGYSDNTGLMTAVEMIHDLGSYYNKNKKEPPFERVLFLRIEPFAPDEATLHREIGGFQSAFFGPSLALDAARVSTQAERAELELKMLQELSDPLSKPLWDVSNPIDEINAIGSQLARNNANLGGELKTIASTLRGITSQCRVGATTDLDQRATQFNKGLGKAIDKINAIQKEAPPEYSKQLEPKVTSLKKTMNLVDQVQQTKQERGRFPFRIESVTFRFASTNDKVASKVKPPLSWTLSPAQKRAIEEAWEEQSIRSNRPGVSADTITPADLTSDEWFPRKK